MSPNIPIWSILNHAIEITQIVQTEIERVLRRDPGYRYKRIKIQLGEKEKPALALDEVAESKCGTEIEVRFNGDVEVLGEETLKGKRDLSKETKIWAITDMIDGTDLLEMGIPMWCSAIVFFDPRVPEILLSVIRMANGEIYYATKSSPMEAFVHRIDNPLYPVPLRGPSKVPDISLATIGFYGQKAKNFIAVLDYPYFLQKLRSIPSESYFRMHTLAGNPAMIKLADRHLDNEREVVGRNFDLIFDVCGQYPHDVVPGAYIAMQAGAYLCDLNGVKIDEAMLVKKLLYPTEKMTYILASTKTLADNFYPLLKREM